MFFSDFLYRQSQPKPPPSSELEDWDEMKTKFKPEMYLRASTWQPFTLYDVPAGTPVEFGPWIYDHRVLPKHSSLRLAQGGKRGSVMFDDDVIIPRVMEKGRRGTTVWMSYTPMEVLSQRAGVRMATGNVVIGGLGMGWIANRVAARKQVKKVVVVERDENIIKLAAPAITSSKVSIVHGDLWATVKDMDDSWTYLFDIWPTYGGNKHDYHYTQFLKTHPKAKTWVWG